MLSTIAIVVAALYIYNTINSSVTQCNAENSVDGECIAGEDDNTVIRIQCQLWVASVAAIVLGSDCEEFTF